MIFNSLPFLIFIAAFLPIYFSLKGKSRILFCLVASYFFYGWWDWRFLSLIVISTCIDYALALQIEKTDDNKQRKQLLILSLIANLGVLAFFKYFNFFADSLEILMLSVGIQPSFNTLNIILPVGISFYTFQSMSYTIDVYRKNIPVETDFLRFATYIAFFPQLVAGPIVRAADFLPQFRREVKFDWERFIAGLTQVLWGFFKKVAIADSLAPFVDQCFQMPDNFTTIHLVVGIIFYSFQIYCDFSGYSDIAIGLARMMGFDFPMNFRTPYFSKSFSEFWTRWHITLSSWLRDYLYIPLGGNRNGTLMTYRNLMLTMLLGGLWHGASWTFVVWGFLHGMYLVMQRLLADTITNTYQFLRIPNFIQVISSITVVYFLTCFAWIYFRSPTFEVANTIIAKIAAMDHLNPDSIINKFIFLKGVLLITFLLLVEITDFRFNYLYLTVQRPIFRLISFALLLWIIAFFGTFGTNAFIYFQF